MPSPVGVLMKRAVLVGLLVGATALTGCAGGGKSEADASGQKQQAGQAEAAPDAKEWFKTNCPAAIKAVTEPSNGKKVVVLTSGPVIAPSGETFRIYRYDATSNTMTPDAVLDATKPLCFTGSRPSTFVEATDPASGKQQSFSEVRGPGYEAGRFYIIGNLSARYVLDASSGETLRGQGEGADLWSLDRNLVDWTNLVANPSGTVQSVCDEVACGG